MLSVPPTPGPQEEPRPALHRDTDSPALQPDRAPGHGPPPDVPSRRTMTTMITITLPGTYNIITITITITYKTMTSTMKQNRQVNLTFCSLMNSNALNLGRRLSSSKSFSSLHRSSSQARSSVSPPSSGYVSDGRKSSGSVKISLSSLKYEGSDDNSSLKLKISNIVGKLQWSPGTAVRPNKERRKV